MPTIRWDREYAAKPAQTMTASSRTTKKAAAVKKLPKAAASLSQVEEKANLKAAKPAKVKKPSLEEPVTPLSSEEQEELLRLEGIIEKSSSEVGEKEGELSSAAWKITDALYQIQSQNLYRAVGKTFEKYSKERFNFSLAHSKRLAKVGKIRAVGENPEHKAIVDLIKNESMARPLTKLSESDLEKVYATLSQWVKWKEKQELSSQTIRAAIAYHADAPGPKASKLSTDVEAIRVEMKSLKSYIDKTNTKSADESFGVIEGVLSRLVDVKRSTGISWTEHTWNPIVGCTYVSEGCRNCYAAFQMGTLIAARHKDLVDRKSGDEGGRKVERYMFNGKIKLLPDKLDEPLRNTKPSKYFVNSLSDLFHKKVNDDFITTVFEMMEKAHWHTFQVLTKRTDLMAAFTKKYYGDRTPPDNIWLGTSAENQETFDERLPHLLETKTALRWLSMEPLLGSVEIKSLEGLDWIVVGGESGSEARKMEADWVRSIRDACKKEKVPFFFKQWGKFGEEGQELKGKATKAKPKLDGVVHNNWPEQTKVDTVGKSSE